MITAENWWEIIKNYNNTIFPTQIILHLVAIIIVLVFFIKPQKEMSLILKGYLTFSFAWIGIVFFLILGNGLDSYIFSALLFISIAVFFCIDIFRKKFEFQIPEIRWQRYLMGILLLTTIFYPLAGFLIGHIYPSAIFLGTFPCSTTALALILLSFSVPNVDIKPYILLLIWAIPFPILIQIPKFGVYEDSIMLISGLFAIGFLIKNWKLLSKKNLL